MVEAGESIEFKWCKKRGVGGKKKEVQFYESFTFDGADYTLYDSVYLYKESETEPYIGKIIKIWENPDKSKRVKILWFFRPCEIQNYIGAEEVAENELFLASGEGKGLANINPLEAIAGKCNVICISKDERNPQPSYEELHMADFVFYRTFDVAQLKISDNIDDKIAGIEAGIRKFDGFVKDNPISKEDNERDSPMIGASDRSAISLRLITNDETKDLKASEKCEDILGKGDVSLESSSVKDAPNEHVSLMSKAGLDGSKGKSDFAPNIEIGTQEEIKPLQNLDDDDRPLKKAKLDVFTGRLSKEKSKNHVEDSATRCDGFLKASKEALIKPKDKSRIVSELAYRDLGPSNKLSQDKPKFSKSKLAKTSSDSALGDEDAVDYQSKEVIPRHDIENKIRWFKYHWEEHMAEAQKKGMLVLLRNLDPTYTSHQVEDIIWYGLKFKCTAKMIQHTTISSPHSGEAFVIFKTREAAERAVRRLADGCLLLPNGRPLVGCWGDTSFPGKQQTFHGHLVFASSRQPLNREREAVSTAHCSQSNTIEYEMAIDWRFFQEKWDRAWQLLYKQQGQELRKIQANLKSK